MLLFAFAERSPHPTLWWPGRHCTPLKATEATCLWRYTCFIGRSVEWTIRIDIDHKCLGISLNMLEVELFSFLENTTDAVFVVTGQGEIRFWNRSAVKLFGYSAADAKGKTCFDLLHGIGALGTSVCHQNCSVLDCIGKGSEVPNFDLNVSACSGERLWVNISTLIFHNQRTRETLLVHLAHDITEQKKQDEVVRQVLTLSKELSSLGERIGKTAPVSPLSLQEIEILKMFAAAAVPPKSPRSLE